MTTTITRIADSCLTVTTDEGTTLFDPGFFAYDLGKKNVRINAVSAGPVKTVAARSIPGFMKMYKQVAAMTPLGRQIDQEDVGNLGLFLLSMAQELWQMAVVFCGLVAVGAAPTPDRVL